MGRYGVFALLVMGIVTARLQKRLHQKANIYNMRFLLKKLLDSLWQLC